MNDVQSGRVKVWDDAKGYGFIAPDSGGRDVFFHVSGLVRPRVRPVVGETVRFRPTVGDDGKPRAADVRLDRRWQWLTWGRALSVGWLAGLAVLAAAGVFPAWVPLAYTAMSLSTVAVYAADKRRAGTAARRVPERTLHLLALVGGWPGALLAQQELRHKTRKVGFQSLFWLIVIGHAAAVGLAVWLLR
jgi:uncharacterized membrane protein YsdA (DUF1294 family)/cold shock CspA family protein